MKAQSIVKSSSDLTENKIYSVKEIKYYSLYDDSGYIRVMPAEHFKLIEEPQMTQFKDMKIRITSPEHSEKVQKYLFSLGYKWWKHKDQAIQRQDSQFIYIYCDGEISAAETDCEDYFNSHKNPEFTLEETVTYSLKEIPKPPPVETIEIGGMLYAKRDVEDALKGLKAVV